MQQLIQQMKNRLRANERVVLCTILQASGSTPRKAGAKMAVYPDGSIDGTVGGGEMERRAMLRASELLAEGRSATGHFLLHPDRTQDIGMVCGGEVLLGFVCLDPADEAACAVLDRIAEQLAGSGRCWLETVYGPDGSAAMQVLTEDLHDDDALPRSPQLTQTADRTVLLEPITRNERVFLFGGGHVGRALVPALHAVGYAVTVYDSRPALADPARWPQAERVLCGPFEEAFSGLEIGPADSTVVMTPGHKADYQVLRQALRTPAGYIGCIGSAKKVAYVNGCLKADGFSEAEIGRIHSPIGLPILAQTPEEIAVSITAQLILHRHGGL